MNSSFESSASSYHNLVGASGHYYHQEVIFPELIKWMKFTKKSSLLDMGCGQGVILEVLPKEVEYVGVDLSESLLQFAKKRGRGRFYHKDATKLFTLDRKFEYVLFLLSLQNMSDLKGAFLNAKEHLLPSGKLILVLNHPCFRIPRQSAWGEDKEKKIQYRRVDSYMSTQKIPILTHPGKKDSPVTYTYHYSLSELTRELKKQGFVIEEMAELCSNRVSEGGKKKMEDRARNEFPLFLMLKCALKP